MGRNRANKKKRKVEKQVNSLLEKESEAFQARIDDATVKDVSYLDRDRKPKGEVHPEELESEEEELTPYQLLMNSLGTKRAEPKPEEQRQQKKRKLESSTEERKSKKKKVEDGTAEFVEVDAADADWTVTRERLEKEEKAKALKNKLLMSGNEVGDNGEGDMSIFTDKDEKKGLNDPYLNQFEEDPKITQNVPPFQELEDHGVAQTRVWSNTLEALPEEVLGMKLALIESWNKYYQEEWNKKKRKNLGYLQMTPYQTALMKVFSSYQDLCLTNQNLSNKKEIRTCYVLHVLNHIIKIRERVQRHDAILKELNATQPDHTVEHRDQGFVRPRVLILLPTRNDCFELVEKIIRIAPRTLAEHVSYKKKFHEEFFDETYIPISRKPEDWLERFKGNLDDGFRIGLSLSGKYINLFTEFYKSDIIIASPLGLKLAIAQKESDIDFLSSIEMVILDSAESHLMQNWEHLTFVFESLNQPPKEIQSTTDISRIRFHFIDGKAKHVRQSLFFSEVEHVDLNSLFKRHCYNHAGKIKITADSGSGSISLVGPKIKQHFQRLECHSVSEIADFRFNYFVTQVYPHLLNDVMKGVLIYVPSYFDFVRVRNFLRVRRKKGDLTFVQCCEYSPPNHVSRNRSNFFHGERDWMLFTERFHYFNRYAIRGIKKIIFYAPPTFPVYYPEMLNLMNEEGTCLVLFSSFDVYQLEPILGSKRCQRLLTSEKSYHMMV